MQNEVYLNILYFLLDVEKNSPLISEQGATTMIMKPAEYVVKQFGGVRKTARTIGRSPAAVCKWNKSKADGGLGGTVPKGLQTTILQMAEDLELDITPADLILGREIADEDVD